MRLKRIEILGFKSFKERTVFTFPSRITAIVGPNGCGKSNIVDAALWAMGEMRPTHLRGRSMEDVIFNGTETLKPLGMAEVSLIFANEGGPPLEGYGEYSEIMVTRRLFRSGESEYLINKVPCRLKDIRDLFLGTGVGVNAYSTIEQGQVEMLLNARPQDRRHLIEEAAGVTRYKERKRETLLKMDRTQQNLLRVQDVIAEVRRQMNALRRQAAQARRYREYQREIKDLEIGLALVEFGEKEEELRRVRGYLQGRRDEEEGRLAQLGHTEGELEEFKRRLLEGEEALSQVQGKIYRIEGQIQRQEERSKSLDRELEGLHSLEDQYGEEIEGLGQEQGRLRERKGVFQKELDEAGQKVKETKELLETEEGELGDLEGRCTERGRALEDLRNEVLQDSAQLTRLHNLVEDSRRREKGLLERRARLERELKDLLKEEKGMEEKVRREEEAAKGLARRKEALELDVRRAEEELKCLQEGLSQKEAEFKEVEGELHRLRLHQSSLADMQRRFEGYTEGVRAIMASEEAPFKEGVIGILTDLVEVEPPYEAALEAALGHKLQSILVKGKKEALRAIQYLKKGGLGRGSFLPLDVIPPRSHHSPIQEKGNPQFLGPLLEFVKVKGGYRPLLEALLDGVWLFRDLAGIMEAERPGCGVFVTLEGELLDRTGILTGGSWDTSLSGILTRKREIKETEKAVTHKEMEYQGLNQGLDELREKAVVAKGSLETLREEGYELEREEVRVKGEVEDVKRDLLAIKRKGEVLRFELGQIDMETAQLHEEIKTALAQIEDCRKTKEEKEGYIEKLRGMLLGIWGERDKLREGVTGLRVQLASLQEREKSLLRSMEELEKAGVSLSAQQRRKEGQLKEVQARIQAAIEAEKVVRESLGRLIAARDHKTKSLEGEGEKVKGLRGEISAREASLKGLRAELKEIQESIAQQGVRLSQIEMEMRHLAERIQERYGLSLASLMKKGDYPTVEREEAEKRLAELRIKVERLGEVNPGAVEEYEDLKKRHEFLEAQKEDLQKSLATLGRTIAEINRTSTKRFRETFARASKEFQGLIPRLFDGGRGELVLDESSPEPGVDIFMQPAGKRLKSVDLLSGGEKALAATAFIFALFLLRPTPFCLLDEIDSPLDDANIDRFATILREMSEQSQFILITHNKGTMKIADALYGVTMETPGVSKVVSVRLN
ncbi:MAG: chromosome segregation protein SMC [Deltaproteobacteria bacterium]|nr:chromosome segregation protein SMC [Deltaproteobacteria bacterium]